MDLDQVLLSIEGEVPLEGHVRVSQDVLPVLRAGGVAEGGEDGLSLPLQVDVPAIKKTRIQL